MPRPLSRPIINRFFKILAENLDRKAYVLLTGAAAGNVLGKIRPSNDIDFAIRLADQDRKSWDQIHEAVQKTIRLTGINANYIDDIDRWGLISLMDYMKHTLPYQQFGQIKVEVLEPAYWSIGKMTRYLAPDIQDMIQVFKKQRVLCSELTQIWALALKKSPRSTTLFDFIKHVEDFLKHYGRQVWGKSFNAEEEIRGFRKAAGIKQNFK